MWPLNEHNLCWIFCRPRVGRSLVLPRFTPPGWYECDVCEVTDAGYLREYEIKLSRRDFWADSYKGMAPGRLSKHEKLRMRADVGPSQFWFIIPVGLVPVDQVPDFAGVYTVQWNSTSPWKSTFLEKRPAPRLHSHKVDARMRQRMIGTAYWRFHSQMHRNAMENGNKTR